MLIILPPTESALFAWLPALRVRQKLILSQAQPFRLVCIAREAKIAFNDGGCISVARSLAGSPWSLITRSLDLSSLESACYDSKPQQAITELRVPQRARAGHKALDEDCLLDELGKLSAKVS